MKAYYNKFCTGVQTCLEMVDASTICNIGKKSQKEVVACVTPKKRKHDESSSSGETSAGACEEDPSYILSSGNSADITIEG